MRSTLGKIRRRVNLEIQNSFRGVRGLRRKLPDFLIIGAQKAGTSSLFHYMGQHPGVKLAQYKEIHFFNLRFNRSLNWYRSFFPKQSFPGITGEATPAYLRHPLAPFRIRHAIPNVKVLVVLRDPVERAFSHFQMQRRLGIETCVSFEDALDNEQRIRDAESEKRKKDADFYSYADHNCSYVGRGLYYTQISRWLKHVDRKQFLFLKSEDFFQDPNQTLRSVFRFLDLPEHEILDTSSVNRGNYAAKISPRIRQRLEQCFQNENEQLTALLGEKFRW